MFVYKLLNSKPLGPWVYPGMRDARSGLAVEKCVGSCGAWRANAFPTYRRFPRVACFVG